MHNMKQKHFVWLESQSTNDVISSVTSKQFEKSPTRKKSEAIRVSNVIMISNTHSSIVNETLSIWYCAFQNLLRG